MVVTMMGRNGEGPAQGAALGAPSAGAKPCAPVAATGRVLALGVCLLDRPHNIAHIVQALHQSTRWDLVQRWVGLGRGAVPGALAPLTAFTRPELVPKFVLLNELLQGFSLPEYDYVLIVDDDITLPDGFVDEYLGLARRYDFALAQPARTTDSFMNHRFVAQVPELKGRWTRFVEIGPLFSIRRDLFSTLLPFDESSPMGWGYDFVWPCLVEQRGLRMGIIDAMPIGHRLRGQARTYPYRETARQMDQYLEQHEHLDEERAFSVLETYA